MIQNRLAALEEQYEQFEKLHHKEGDYKLFIRWIMESARQDIIMDKIYYKNLHIDEDLNIKSDDGGE